MVVQALRRAHLDALRAVLKTFRDAIATHPDRAALEGFADRVAAFTKVEWTAAERLAFRRPGTLTPAEGDIRHTVAETLAEAGRPDEIEVALRGIMGHDLYEAYSQARSEPPPPGSS